MRRLKPFSYFEPTTLSEAIEILAKQGSGACFLAGGTDLLARMKKGEITPSALVNLKRIGGLDHIGREPGGSLHIGALTPISAVECSPPWSARTTPSWCRLRVFWALPRLETWRLWEGM